MLKQRISTILLLIWFVALGVYASDYQELRNTVILELSDSLAAKKYIDQITKMIKDRDPEKKLGGLVEKLEQVLHEEYKKALPEALEGWTYEELKGLSVFENNPLINIGIQDLENNLLPKHLRIGVSGYNILPADDQYPKNIFLDEIKKKNFPLFMAALKEYERKISAYAIKQVKNGSLADWDGVIEESAWNKIFLCSYYEASNFTIFSQQHLENIAAHAFGSLCRDLYDEHANYIVMISNFIGKVGDQKVNIYREKMQELVGIRISPRIEELIKEFNLEAGQI